MSRKIKLKWYECAYSCAFKLCTVALLLCAVYLGFTKSVLAHPINITIQQGK